MKINFETIHEHIGQLIYAIASGNEKFHDVEKLMRLVDTLWGPVTKDDLVGVHMVGCVKEGIAYCFANFLTSEESLFNFENYFRIHTFPFSKALREKIISSARSVFDAFPSPDGAVKVDQIIQLLSEHELQESK